MPHKKKKRRQSKAQQVRKEFSPARSAAEPVEPCAARQHAVPDKPCNLQMMRLVESDADCSGERKTRSVEIRKGQALNRNASPTLLPAGETFQITASSEANGQPRVLNLEVSTAADCLSSKHPEAEWQDARGAQQKVGKQQKLEFYRPPLRGDDVGLGFFTIVNAIFGQKPVSYPVEARCCGMPPQPGGGSVESLGATIEVFPADKYSLELSFPALCKPHALEFSRASESWTTQRERDEKKIEAAGDKADELYKENKEAMELLGSKAEFREFAEDMKKRQIGFVEGDPEIPKVSLTQTDGRRSLKAPVDDVIQLVRLIRNAEYRLKEFERWVDNFQVGPGVRFKVECQFFVAKITAKWGYTEYLDDRVFLSYSGSADIDIIKANLDLSLGFKCAGAADLLLVLKGEGTLGLTVPEFTKEQPDEPPKGKVKPRGELKITGGVEGTVLWAAHAEGVVEVTFKADTEELEILSEHAVLAGKIVVSREPVMAKLTYSCTLWGARTKSKELVKADPKLAEFTF